MALGIMLLPLAAFAQPVQRGHGGLSGDESPAAARVPQRAVAGDGAALHTPPHSDPPDITVRGFGPSLTRQQELDAIRDGWKR